MNNLIPNQANIVENPVNFVPTPTPPIENQVMEEVPSAPLFHHKLKFVIIFFVLFIIVLGVLYSFIYKRGQQVQNSQIVAPIGYKMVTNNEKVDTNNSYFFETRFEKDNEPASKIVVMKTTKENFCNKPDPNSLVKNYQEVLVSNFSGCQMSWLNEVSKAEQARLIRWNTIDNGYTIMSYDMNVSFDELLLLASQFE